jgi:hypothetical protein
MWCVPPTQRIDPMTHVTPIPNLPSFISGVEGSSEMYGPIYQTVGLHVKVSGAYWLQQLMHLAFCAQFQKTALCVV